MSFLIRRIGQAALTLTLLSLLIFVLSRFIGDPVDFMLPADASPEAETRLRESLGLDRPLPEQYLVYIGNVLRGDLGTSIRGGQPVLAAISGRLPASLSLAGFAMLLTLLFAFPLGVVAALANGKLADGVARFLALLGQSAPSFWVGLLLVQLFGVRLGWLPASGTGSLAHYILPAFTMSLFVIAGVSRLLRTSMLEILESELVRFARSKGVPERSVIWKHALRNALIPVISFGGVYFSILVTMAVVVEVVFAWPGIGRLAYNAILHRDYPLMQGVVLATGVIVVVVNMIVDIAYAIVDPRIRVDAK